MHRSPRLSVDLVLSKILAKEISLKSYSEKGIISAPNPYVLVIPSKSPPNSQKKSYTRVAFDECIFCNQKDHWKT